MYWANTGVTASSQAAAPANATAPNRFVKIAIQLSDTRSWPGPQPGRGVGSSAPVPPHVCAPKGDRTRPGIGGQCPEHLGNFGQAKRLRHDSSRPQLAEALLGVTAEVPAH